MFLAAGVNVGDIIYQLVAFLFLLTIPTLGVVFFIALKRKKSRIDRLEEKVDLLIAKKEQ